MKTIHLTTIRMFGLFATLGLAMASAQTTIYSDDFSGSSATDLHAEAPDIRPGSETWSASTLWKSDGTVGSAPVGANAFLPFTPVAGRIYTLSATVDVTSTSDDWLALGFTNGSDVDQYFHVIPNDPAAWMLERGGLGDSGYQTIAFMGPGATGSTSAVSSDGPIALRVELNTQNPLWSVSFYRNNVQMGSTMSYTTNPTLNYVAMGRGLTAAGSMDDFSLSYIQTFSGWIAGYDVASQDGVNDDPDGDGTENGVENYFGINPAVFSQGLVSGAVDSGAGTFTFTHPINSAPATDLTAAYRWSKDLVTFHADETSFEGTTVTFTEGAPSGGFITVTATVTGTPLTKLFVDVSATQN